MKFLRNLVALITLALLLHSDSDKTSAEPAGVFSFIHDLVQYNLAGPPAVHEYTQWNFDPEVGKKRRVRYEMENGRHGMLAVAKIGMGIGYEGDWGKLKY